uniref:Ribosomal protein L15 n=1 Tax=Angiostrongylus cantonensis TaxID=6313 RepID=A0A158P8R2_ANGCA
MWRKKQSDDMLSVLHIRTWHLLAVNPVSRETRPEKARRIGYRARQGGVLYRVCVRRGSLKFTPTEQAIAEDRVGHRLGSLRVLSSHGVGEYSGYKFYAVVLESVEACRLWREGVHNLMIETRDIFISGHSARIERFIAKHFLNLVTPGTEFVARKHMKPFVQTSLQYKVPSRVLQEVTEDQMNLLQFSQATRNFIHSETLFASRFSELSQNGATVSFTNFMRFLENMQNDPMSSNRARVVGFLRRYLTGDQLRSDSSLDSYAQALLMVDCWDGQRKPNSQEFMDIVVYHGYTMTSKLLLRDVLNVKYGYYYRYPVILSIEDNCSVPAQRLLAQEIKEILGDDLLTQPINSSETQLPSPAALKRKIILKHKKLPIENENLASFVAASADEFQDTDILSRECIKKGVLALKDNIRHEWSPHIFILFPDRICYLLETCDDSSLKDDNSSITGDDEREEEPITGFGVRPEEQHITEEWFHGHCGREEAKMRILQHRSRGNGLFMVRDSNLFIGEKKYYFMENKLCDTLYELVSYYTRHYLTTPTFKMVLTTPCPQPQPHLGQPWFSETADKEKAESLLSQVPEDGAFLLRYSGIDKNVFVLSIRVDGEIWHYRLKRDGRIFVVNQTMFENLNQIVEYYRTREFVRGISLSFPVNEMAVNLNPGNIETAEGSYQDLSQLEEKILARALRPYRGMAEDDLSFPANAIITVLRKEEALWTEHNKKFKPQVVTDLLSAGFQRLMFRKFCRRKLLLPKVGRLCSLLNVQFVITGIYFLICLDSLNPDGSAF